MPTTIEDGRDRSPRRDVETVGMADQATKLSIPRAIYERSLWRGFADSVPSDLPTTAAASSGFFLGDDFLEALRSGEAEANDAAVWSETADSVLFSAPAILASADLSDEMWRRLVAFESEGLDTPQGADPAEFAKYNMLCCLNCRRMLVDSPADEAVKSRWNEAILVYAGFVLKELDVQHQLGKTTQAEPAAKLRDELIDFLVGHPTFGPAAKDLLEQWGELQEKAELYSSEYRIEVYCGEPDEEPDILEQAACAMENFETIARFSNAMAPTGPDGEWYRAGELLPAMLTKGNLVMGGRSHHPLNSAPFAQAVSGTFEELAGFAGCGVLCGVGWVAPLVEGDRSGRTADVFIKLVNEFLDCNKRTSVRSLGRYLGFKSESDDPRVEHALEFYESLQSVSHEKGLPVRLVKEWGEVADASHSRKAIIWCDIYPSAERRASAGEQRVFVAPALAPADYDFSERLRNPTDLYRLAAHEVIRRHGADTLKRGFLSYDNYRRIESAVGPSSTAFGFLDGVLEPLDGAVFVGQDDSGPKEQVGAPASTPSEVLV